MPRAKAKIGGDYLRNKLSTVCAEISDETWVLIEKRFSRKIPIKIREKIVFDTNHLLRELVIAEESPTDSQILAEMKQFEEKLNKLYANINDEFRKLTTRTKSRIASSAITLSNKNKIDDKYITTDSSLLLQAMTHARKVNKWKIQGRISNDFAYETWATCLASHILSLGLRISISDRSAVEILQPGSKGGFAFEFLLKTILKENGRSHSDVRFMIKSALKTLKVKK